MVHVEIIRCAHAFLYPVLPWSVVCWVCGSLRLCALHSRKMRNLSGFLHRHAESGRQSQAVCTFWALQSRKMGNVSGYSHFFYEIGRPSQAFCTFCARQPRKLRTVSGYSHFLTPPWENWLTVSGSGHSIPEKCGTSQAFCAAMLKMADRLRLFALFGRSTPENWGRS